MLSREQARARETGPRSGGGTGSFDSIGKALGAAGLLSLAVPERLGGAGLGPLATCVLLTELGRRAVPGPIPATLASGVLPIARHGTEAQQDRLLSGVDDGRVLTAALTEPSAPLTAAPATRARRDGDALVITGTKTGVPHAGLARDLLIPVSLAGGGTAVAVVASDADGLTREPAPPSGSGAAVLRLAEVRGEALGAPGDPEVLADLLRCATAGLCALGDGALAGALALTAEHVRTREQFGRPLAAFQSVAGQLADVYVASRTAHLATTAACWRLDEGLDAADDLAVAALWLTEQAPPAVHTCHHLHGGIGLDISYPLHRHLSMIKDVARGLGGAGRAVDALAERLAGR
ncbi:acyl-CoA dehydrogenase family protein [Saccharopolyspora sp. MS10]|uniref:acyl-CoA dehydrogenase family protein n=1 Tax=Saccharopolyspora sp. MS10 TaxID=3385973 RepID=UPI0039A33505